MTMMIPIPLVRNIAQYRIIESSSAQNCRKHAFIFIVPNHTSSQTHLNLHPSLKLKNINYPSKNKDLGLQSADQISAPKLIKPSNPICFFNHIYHFRSQKFYYFKLQRKPRKINQNQLKNPKNLRNPILFNFF
ncbi:hypothetical protein TorRG33x02_058290, partial [Trema orientale]